MWGDYAVLFFERANKTFNDVSIIHVLLLIDTQEVLCVIKRGEFLGSEKVVNIPGNSASMTALTKQDERDIRTGIQLRVDAIVIPGARNAVYINNVKNFVCTWIIFLATVFPYTEHSYRYASCSRRLFF